MTSGVKTAGRWCWWYRNQLIAILTPLVFLPIPLVINDDAARCGYVIIVTAIFWCTQCVPLYVTGLLPAFIFPLMEMMTPAQVASFFYRDIVLFVLGTLMLALSVENVGLHRRTALFILQLAGGSQQRILIGLVFSSAFISMWISDLSTVVVLLTILEVVFDEAEEGAEPKDAKATVNDMKMDEIKSIASVQSPGSDEPTVLVGEVNDVAVIDLEPRTNKLEINPKSENADSKPTKRQPRPEEIAMTQAVLYGSRIGGGSILTGNITNLILIDFINIFYQENGQEQPVTWSKWAMVFLPISVVSMVVIQLWVQIYNFGWRALRCNKTKTRDEKQERMARIFKQHYKDLGSISYAEVWVLLIFATVVLLWFFRDPGFMDGWKEYFPPGFTSASLPALLFSCVMFVIPQRPPWTPPEEGKDKPATLLEWPIVHNKMMWGFLLMFGGATTTAAAAGTSGFVDWFGDQLEWLEDLPIPLLVFTLTLMTSLMTEFASFMTVISILLPVLGPMAIRMGYSPLLLMLPCGLGAGYSVMLPQASIVLAVVYNFNRVRVSDMVKSGIVADVLFCLVVTLGLCTWGMAILDLKTVPWDIPEATNDSLTTVMP